VLDAEGNENDDIKIRKCKIQDIDRILEIEEQAFPKTAFRREDFLSFANNLPDSFVVITIGNEIAGYIIFDMDGHILSMAVKPSFRRKGLGTALFMYALKCANIRLQLEVRSKNSGAITFYKALGMTVAGKLPNYYKDDDALIMVFSKRNGWK
jgi:ribosomal-protein-alanine N-acetyltransferase